MYYKRSERKLGKYKGEQTFTMGENGYKNSTEISLYL